MASFYDYVRSFFDTGNTKSKEFELLLRVWGREKIEGFYKQWQIDKKQPFYKPAAFEGDTQKTKVSNFCDRSHPETKT